MAISLLDTDLYKFTTSYAYMKMFPNAIGEFVFTDRDKQIWDNKKLKKLNKNFEETFSTSYITKECVDWCIENIKFIPKYYWEWLSQFSFNHINAFIDNDGHLQIKVVDNIYKATLYEIPILYTVSKTMCDENKIDYKLVIENLAPKIELANKYNIKFSEFGTRRRCSLNVQMTVLSYIRKHSKTCTGTSNVFLAKLYGMKPMGTHPHEWFMFHGAQFGYKHANYLALENWSNIYDGDLGIALTDTYTSDMFFKNFSKKHAKLFDGVRQDSGDEYEFINKTIKRYNELGIDPTTKTIVFSNALDFNKAKEINYFCKGKINASFGIGTNLTNDCGFKKPNIVMKLLRCKMNEYSNWCDCVKLSDDVGKHLGKQEEIDNALYNIR